MRAKKKRKNICNYNIYYTDISKQKYLLHNYKYL